MKETRRTSVCSDFNKQSPQQAVRYQNATTNFFFKFHYESGIPRKKGKLKGRIFFFFFSSCESTITYHIESCQVSVLDKRKEGSIKIK